MSIITMKKINGLTLRNKFPIDAEKETENKSIEES